MNAKSYIFHVAVFSAVASLLVLALNYFVDPYAIFDAKRIAGFNQYKVDINKHTRLSKKYQPLHRQHSALIVGNSRVELGLNPAHRCFRENNLHSYNLGLPGASVRTQLEYALNVMHHQEIERVFLSVDFTDFLSSTPKPGRRPQRLSDRNRGSLQYLPTGRENPEYTVLRFLDYYKSLYSLNALVSSVKTIALQGEQATDRDVSGFNPAGDFASAVEIEGPRVLFDQKLFELNRKYSNRWYLRNSEGQLDTAFDDLDDFLTLAKELGVEVTLFTNPFHDSYWKLMEQKGLMPLYIDWLESLKSLVRDREDTRVALWDFSPASAFIREPVPARGVKSGALNWFWEPAHYTQALGDLMVDAMLSEQCDSKAAFGVKVF